MRDTTRSSVRSVLIPTIAAALMACESPAPPSESSSPAGAEGAAKQGPADPGSEKKKNDDDKKPSQATKPPCEPQAESCNGKDDDCDGAVDEYAPGCSFCARGLGYWKSHPDLWPFAQVTAGSGTYTVAVAIEKFLEKPYASDATISLAAHLITAKLNVAMGSPGSEDIASTIAAADAFLVDHPVGSAPAGADKTAALELKDKLEAFNESGEKGCTCAPKCDGKECGADGCGSYCGVCAAGSACDGGKCECTPTLELCDGIDNDCDGETDEDQGTLRCGVGGCEVTKPACIDGELQLCIPKEPTPEVCNGVDDNCDFVVDAIACDDGSACTIDDLCLEGTCDGSPVDCTDGNVCTDDLCDPDSGCYGTPNGAPCDDWNDCTTTDVCVGTWCLGFDEVSCDDGNTCTADECMPGAGCAHHKLGYVPCSDGNPCTGGDHCNAGECAGGGAVACDDGNICTTDACDPTLGCTHVPDDNQGTHSCGVGACKVEVPVCVAGALQLCTPGEPTAETCNNIDDDCDFVVDAIKCNDDNACTIDDLCLEGHCDGSPVDCSDGNPCTDDLCDKVTGCDCVANAKGCDDWNACTTSDVCADKGCVGSGALACDDGNPCTADGCDPATGCTHSPQPGPCSDGDACTAGEACSGGACSGGAAISCDDANPCTTDTCAAATGCAHAAVGNGTTCDDGNACSGTCKGQDPGTIHHYAVSTAWTDPKVGWAGSGHSIVAWGLLDGASAAVLTAKPDLFFDVLDDGTAHMHGTAVVTSGGPAGELWTVDIWWSLRGTGPAGQGTGGPKLELKGGVQTPAITNTWDYYDMWPGGAFLTKVGSPKDVAWLTQLPAGSVYPFQLGVGANGKNLHFGGSGWIGYTRYASNGAVWSGKGDINVDTTELPLCTPGDVCHAGLCGYPQQTCE